ncbi:hypothetical protein DFH27DRAFT_398903 [Peziza echinospora]|nr:hypothetical protein DFH27DRAFT_398903 [Peziza echinospora]
MPAMACRPAFLGPTCALCIVFVPFWPAEFRIQFMRCVRIPICGLHIKHASQYERTIHCDLEEKEGNLRNLELRIQIQQLFQINVPRIFCSSTLVKCTPLPSSTSQFLFSKKCSMEDRPN